MKPVDPIIIRAEVMWCFHNKISEMSGKYQVDLCNLSEGAVKALQNLGLDPRQREDKPEKGYFITAKSVIPIKVFNKDGDSLSDIAIGNGSKAVVHVGPYEWKWKGKSGLSPSIVKMIIEDLRSYGGDVDSNEYAEDDIL